MAQLFVIVVTVIVFCHVLSPNVRLLFLIKTAKFSIIGGANIFFGTQDEEVMYIDDDTTDLSLSRNPFMHMWYLGVEEQVRASLPVIIVDNLLPTLIK